MTQTVTQITNKLQTKVFTPYGKNVTLQKRGTPTYDNYGSISSVTFTSSTISVIPYEMNSDKLAFERFSEINAGDTFVAVPYSVTVSTLDRLTIDGDIYEVREIAPHDFPTNVLTILKLVKLLS